MGSHFFSASHRYFTRKEEPNPIVIENIGDMISTLLTMFQQQIDPAVNLFQNDIDTKCAVIMIIILMIIRVARRLIFLFVINRQLKQLIAIHRSFPSTFKPPAIFICQHFFSCFECGKYFTAHLYVEVDCNIDRHHN